MDSTGSASDQSSVAYVHTPLLRILLRTKFIYQTQVCFCAAQTDTGSIYLSYVCVYMCVCVCMSVRVCMYVCVSVYVCMCEWVCVVCMCMYACVCMEVCVCVYTNW